jgi:WD40 repeat protein
MLAYARLLTWTVVPLCLIAIDPQEKKTSCPADGLKREKIAERDLTEAGDGNPDAAPPELVAVRPSAGEQHGYTCVTFSLDGKLLILGAQDGRITVWDLSRNRATDFLAHKGRVWDVRIGPNKKTYASTGSDGKVYVRPLTGSGTPLVFRDKGGDYCTLAYSPDGKLLAMSSSGSNSGSLRLHNLTNLSKEVPLRGREFKVSATAISPDGKYLVAGSWEGNVGRVRFWDTKTGAQMHLLDNPDRPAHTLAFRPDGSLLASAHDYRNHIQLWDPLSGQKARSLQGHTSTVQWIAFSPDGKVLASIGQDRTVRLWHPDTGKVIRQIRVGPKEGLNRLAFSPEGRHLAVVSATGAAYILRLAGPGEPLPGN